MKYCGRFSVLLRRTTLARLLGSKLIRNVSSIGCTGCGGLGWRRRRELLCTVCHGRGALPGTSEDIELLKRRQFESGLPPVVVAGAGIGGVTLGLALQQRGVPTVLLERDASFAERRQGYGLTMQGRSGSAVLRQLGVKLVDTVISRSNWSYAQDGRVVGSYTTHNARRSPDSTVTEDDGKHNVHVPRQSLRSTVLSHLFPDTVRWGVSLDRYEETGEDGVKLHLSDGSSMHASALVGADGIHSIIRADKLRHPLNFLGLMVVLGISELEHPFLQQRVNQTLDGRGTRLYSMPFAPKPQGIRDDSNDGAPNSDERVRHSTMWQLSFPLDLDAAVVMGASGDALKHEALRRCGAWHGPIAELLASTPAELITGYPVYDRDLPSAEEFRGDPRSRVTMIGDAAHPMSPFKGQGANQALLDALSLAHKLSIALGTMDVPTFGSLPDAHADFPRSVSGALAVFEREMLFRAGKKALASREAATLLHSPSALHPMDCTRAQAARAALRVQSQAALCNVEGAVVPAVAMAG